MRILDLIRAVLISPEVLVGLIPFLLLAYWPEPAVFLTEQIAGDLKWGFGAVMAPITFMAVAYQLGSDVLSPQGTRRALLDWPDYPMLKGRVLLTLATCIVGALLAGVGLYMVARSKSVFGSTLILAGVLASATSLATVALAKWKIREIVRE